MPTGQRTEQTPAADTEIQEFFDRMGRAVTSGDGHGAAELWGLPALILGDREARSVVDRTELATFLGGAKQQYNARGITDTRAELCDFRWLTPRIALAQVRWPYLDGRGAERGAETSTYTLRRDDAGTLKLQAAVMHGEERPG